jgi:hypothetical protein
MLGKQIGRREFLTAGGAALGSLSLATQGLPGLVDEQRRGRLLASFDCTKDHPPEHYLSSGNSKVVESAAGRYREAEAKPRARFGYRFPLEHIGKPHLLVVRYPDDKRRSMCIMDGTSYDLSTGVYTGHEQPLSGKMLEIRQVFWPRWNDCSITFLSWGEGEPAAASGFEIYELDDLPAFAVPGDPGDGSRRELGIQYEDPCGTGFSEGATTREQWLERIIAYARHSGQKLFAYPVAWYHGPQFPSQREPSDGFDLVAGRDRKQYIRWTSHPQDWYAHLLERFGQEGLEYQASLTLMRLGSLMQKMNIDLDSIKGGADTINNMLGTDQVQAGTQDWTPIYNVRNFPKALELGRMNKLPWVYGEKTQQPYHGGPIFNPLHPVVQEAVIGFAAEIATRYARYPAFKGISFNMWHTTILWYAFLHAGYDDYTVSLFEKETGITVPVDRKAADRFSKRHAFLTYNGRPAWIAWRCQKIYELCRRIRDVVVAARSDLRVTLTLFPGMVLDTGAGVGLSYAQSTMLDVLHEAGIDITLFRDEPGIELDLSFDPKSLDQPLLDAMHALPRPGVWIFNSWLEDFGKWKWFACAPDDAQSRELAVMDGKPAEGIFRQNSEFPPDGFWWDSQWRISAAFPAGVHFMEGYAHAVAELDACRITRGGLYLDTAHGEEIRKFALAYRALPKRKFETVGATTDPVAARTLLHDSKRYFYLVNRDYYPIKVEVAFDRFPGTVKDLASQKNLPGSQRWELVLGPYELRSFSMGSEVKVVGFTVRPPAEIAAALKAEGEQAIREFKEFRASGRFILGMDEMQRGIESAIAEDRLAWLRRALAGYIVGECRARLGRK